ncbi:hypothetical protein CONPUDRAFT_170023 [Coniophora puteana RWD-64-598 SS2]|uniref:Uncharacterized protein n=1 Tax=Coniophora puteana (strain RWD-64-598) TaxID=741705 RepID=R7SI07_CONPW|nr:uncharacterized protein CONPUDRAFT_170023 [Coniophora puteana RWD-64-598 SS2]EIW74679.1 hypothetical protein CONPUDRAFT_170023 [Coniophora puteana RWD-64-598 SS2]
MAGHLPDMVDNGSDYWRRLMDVVSFEAYEKTAPTKILHPELLPVLSAFAAHTLKREDRLAGQFFFPDKKPDAALTSVLPTIALQLGVRHGRIRQMIIDTLRDAPELIADDHSFMDHIYPFFIRPLRRLKEKQETARGALKTNTYVFAGIQERGASPPEFANVLRLLESLADCLSHYDDLPNTHIFLATDLADHTRDEVFTALQETFTVTYTHAFDVNSTSHLQLACFHVRHR